MVTTSKHANYVPAFSNGTSTAQQNEVSPSHPLHHVVGNKGHQPHHHGQPVIANTLEEWLTSGMVKDGSEETKRNVVQGALPLPQGYTGCTAQSILAQATQTGVTILPVRIPLAETSVDNQKPWTLYHYCNKVSFERIIRTLGKTDLAEDLPNLRKTVISELQADFRERTLHPSPVNPKSEPELVPIEPMKFNSKADILVAVMGKEPQGYSAQGNPLDGFADYCIPFLVPASACMPAHGSCVRVCKDSLDLIHRRAQAKHMQEEKHREEHTARMKKKEESLQNASMGKSWIWRCLCGSSQQNRPEYADDNDIDDHDPDKKIQKDDTKKLSHRELDTWKRQFANEWIKEHFAEVQKKKDIEAKRHVEEERIKSWKRSQKTKTQARAAAEERNAKKGIRIVITGGEESTNAIETSSTMEFLHDSGQSNPMKVIDQLTNSLKWHHPPPSMELFKEFKRHEEEDKEIAKPADPRMKERGSCFAGLIRDTGE